jgi:glycosyltransferase involved in cell wall biosynthesis
LVKFILLTTKDPWLQPTGGTSAFARHILNVFSNEVAVASMSDEDLPVGKWINRKFNNLEVKYLCLGRKDLSKKRFIPVRVYFLLSLLQNVKKLKSIGVTNIYIDTPEAVFALSNDWESACYMFHGLSNPVSNGRYRLFKWLGSLFEKLFIRKLKKLSPRCIFAAADNETIAGFYAKTDFNSKVGQIISFPTRVDQNIFFPSPDIDSLRKELDLNSKIVFTVTGRLAWIKGWDLIIDAFYLFNEKYPDSLLVFVGEGEDRARIQNKIKQLKLEKNVVLTGLLPAAKVAGYINAADLCLVGSYHEGWSVAMCEMLACGKKIVSTNVSGANEMVLSGKNGFVVDDRNPQTFFKAMELCIGDNHFSDVSLELSKKYLLKNLKSDMEHYWQLK